VAVIKYLGSKKRLLPVLGELFTASGARTALDLFTGTTRVAQELKRRGGLVTAVDVSRYSEVFAQCWIETAAADVDTHELADALRHLASLPGTPGYFTDTFCVQSRYLQPKNGERVDAIRDALQRDYVDTQLFPTGSTRPRACRWRTSSNGRRGRPRTSSCAPRS